MERVALDVVGRRAEVQRPPLEEHHGHVHAALARGDHTLAEPLEERLVELREIEPRLPVARHPRTGAGPRLGRHAQVELATRGLRLEVLPAPQPDEVVAAFLQEVQVLPEVEPLRRVRARRARAYPVMEVVPDVGSGQVDGFPFVGCDREVTRVRRGNDEGGRGRG